MIASDEQYRRAREQLLDLEQQLQSMPLDPSGARNRTKIGNRRLRNQLVGKLLRLQKEMARYGPVETTD